MYLRPAGFVLVTVLALGCGGDNSTPPSKPEGSLSGGSATPLKPKLPAFPPPGQEAQSKAEEAQKKAREEIAKFKSFPFQFELPDIHGKKVSLKDYAGKVLIVDFWGTWCPPCREEIPDFIELYKQYHNTGLDIVGINYEQEDDPAKAIEKVADFVKKQGIPYACVMGDEATSKQVPGFDGFPTTLFLDRTGKVRMMLDSRHERPELEAFVTILLEERKASGK